LEDTPGGCGQRPDRFALVKIKSERLLAENVEASLERRRDYGRMRRRGSCDQPRLDVIPFQQGCRGGGGASADFLGDGIGDCRHGISDGVDIDRVARSKGSSVNRPHPPHANNGQSQWFAHDLMLSDSTRNQAVQLVPDDAEPSATTVRSRPESARTPR
jgi:hypothetical protein